MRISVVLWMALLLVLFASPATGQAPGFPMITSAEPQSVKPGELVTAQGVNLGPECMTALYLTDGTTDSKVDILEQTATLVKFKIPPQTRPGRLALMVLTNGKEPKLIEEPVKINIEPETTGNE